MSTTLHAMPTQLDETQQQTAQQLLGALRQPTPSGRVCLVSPGASPTTIELPAEVYRLLLDILGHLADGDAVTVAPIHAEVTTQQAAELLNVSRPYLIKLLDQDVLPFHRVGNRRKLALRDVLDYRRQLIDQHRTKVDEHLRESDQLGLVDNDDLANPLIRG